MAFSIPTSSLHWYGTMRKSVEIIAEIFGVSWFLLFGIESMPSGYQRPDAEMRQWGTRRGSLHCRLRPRGRRIFSQGVERLRIFLRHVEKLCRTARASSLSLRIHISALLVSKGRKCTISRGKFGRETTCVR